MTEEKRKRRKTQITSILSAFFAFVLLVGVRGFEFSPARRLLGHRGSDSRLRLSFTSAPVQILLQQKTKANAFVLLVGVRGFEPPASWSRTKHSTKLSHTPINILFFLRRYISARRILYRNIPVLSISYCKKLFCFR